MYKRQDKLYSENEKIQYIDDDEIPINIDELYQLSKKQEKKETLEDTIKRINEMSTPKKEEYLSLIHILILLLYMIQKDQILELVLLKEIIDVYKRQETP